jgi:succinate-acetate transporter protein/CBS domain-containing protein
MQLREIMTREVNGIRPDAPLSEAITKLKNLEGEPLAVYEGDRLVGMITEHDVIEWNSRGGRDTRLAQVRDVMERDVLYCYEDQDVSDAARLIKDRHAQGVVVMRRNGQKGQSERPVGTVSLADLAVRNQQQVQQREVTREALPQTRIFLQPIAAPSILGAFAFGGSAFMVGAHWANWFAGSDTFLFPFFALFGGLTQLLCAMWAFRARDGVASAMHGTWGSFWLAYGLLQLLFATGTLTQPSPVFAEFGYWFIVLGAISLSGTIASFANNICMASVLLTITAGSGFAAYGYLTGSPTWIPIAGALFIASGLLAWYTGTAMLLQSTFQKRVLPIWRINQKSKLEGRREEATRYDYGVDEPGVRMGQ